MKTVTKLTLAVVVAGAAFVVFVPTWMPVPRAAEQISFPQGVLFHTNAELSDFNKPPNPLPAAAQGGPMATAQYKNVKVLTDVSAAEFDRLQQAITAWVSPKEGCAFCHAGTDYASDAKPTKAVARVMMQMTRHLNADWKQHMGSAGVTCYTCHRGQEVPAAAWFPDPAPEHHPLIDKEDAWNENADTVRKFFPDAGFAEYFLGEAPIAVQSVTAAPSTTQTSWPEAIRIYEMMMQMSDGIGANCGLCHNSRAFASWQESSPYRWNSWYAIRLLRDLNRHYLLPISHMMPESRVLTTATDLPVLPPQDKGPQVGNAFVVCATCHYGITKPMNGANMVNDYPGLDATVAQDAILVPHTPIPHG
jgi:photosynthetic reaction center cytochrome c subunit